MPNPQAPSQPTSPLADAIDASRLRRALVIKLRHHGDVLLATPVLTALKEAAPDCEIDALVYAETAPMLLGHPALAQLHTIDRTWRRQGTIHYIQQEWQLLKALMTRRYDLIVHLTDHPRGGWLTRLCKPKWSVAPRRPGRFWMRCFTHQYAMPGHARRHTVEKNLDALRRLGLAFGTQRLSMTPGNSDQARVDALLAERGISAPFVHIHPASRWFFKCWPAEQMARLTAGLAQAGHTIVMTAAPDQREQDMVTKIIGLSAVPVADLSGLLSLRELAALTARAKLFVGVDSAPMHIAAAMGTPVVALFGPSGDLEWGPWGVRSEVISSDQHPCRPCGQDGCGGSKISDCLVTLPFERVLAACERML